MKLNIDALLKERGKTRYWLAKQVGISYPTMTRLANNEGESTQFKTIEKLCIVLECTPNDLMQIKK